MNIYEKHIEGMFGHVRSCTERPEAGEVEVVIPGDDDTVTFDNLAKLKLLGMKLIDIRFRHYEANCSCGGDSEITFQCRDERFPKVVS